MIAHNSGPEKVSTMIDVLSSNSPSESVDSATEGASHDDSRKDSNAGSRITAPSGHRGGKKNSSSQSNHPIVDVQKFRFMQSSSQVPKQPSNPKNTAGSRIPITTFLGKRQTGTKPMASTSTVNGKPQGGNRSSIADKKVTTKYGINSPGGTFSDLSYEDDTPQKPIVKLGNRRTDKKLNLEEWPEVQIEEEPPLRTVSKHPVHIVVDSEAEPRITDPSKSVHEEIPKAFQVDLVSKTNHKSTKQRPSVIEIETSVQEIAAKPKPSLPRASKGPIRPSPSLLTREKSDFPKAFRDVFNLDTLESLCIQAFSPEEVLGTATEGIHQLTDFLVSHDDWKSQQADPKKRNIPSWMVPREIGDCQYVLPPNPKNSLTRSESEMRTTGSALLRAARHQQNKLGTFLKEVAEDVCIQQHLHSTKQLTAERTLWDEFGSNADLIMQLLREGPTQLAAQYASKSDACIEVVHGMDVDRFFKDMCLPKPSQSLETLLLETRDIPFVTLRCNSVNEFMTYQTKLAEYYGVTVKYMSLEELRSSVPLDADANSEDLLAEAAVGCHTNISQTIQTHQGDTKPGLKCIAEGTFNPEFFPEIETCEDDEIRNRLEMEVPKNTPAKGLETNTVPDKSTKMQLVTTVEAHLMEILANLAKEQVFLRVTQKENFFTASGNKHRTQLYPNLRFSIIDMMVAVSRGKQLNDSTLFLMISIFDRYWWKSQWASEEGNLTLSAWACYLIAAKVEEIYPMDFQELSATWAPGLASLHQLVAVEEDIIKTLGFRLSVPNLYTFWTFVSRICYLSKQARYYGLYLAHVSAKYFEMNYYHPLLQALAVLYLVCRILRGRWWNPKLLQVAHTTFFEVKCCAKSLLFFLHKDRADEEFDEISQKFESASYMHISSLDISRLTLDVF